MMDIPEQLQDLPANGGIYAVWMVFQHYGVDLEINDLVKLCRHNEEEGTSTISLAVALQQLGTAYVTKGVTAETLRAVVPHN